MVKLNTQQIINSVEQNFLKKDVPMLKIGDNIKIGVKIIEGNKERVQFMKEQLLPKKIAQLIQQ